MIARAYNNSASVTHMVREAQVADLPAADGCWDGFRVLVQNFGSIGWGRGFVVQPLLLQSLLGQVKGSWLPRDAASK